MSRRGCDALLPMRSIPSQFRAMTTSRKLPTEPSHFVSLIFRALKAFFGIGTGDSPGSTLKEDYLRAYAEDVFENVAQRCVTHDSHRCVVLSWFSRYIYFLTAMKKTEESLRKLKRGKYDPEKAPKAFSYLAEAAARKYAKEFGGTWNAMFSPSTRKYVAFEAAKEFEAQAARGELDYLLTK